MCEAGLLAQERREASTVLDGVGQKHLRDVHALAGYSDQAHAAFELPRLDVEGNRCLHA